MRGQMKIKPTTPPAGPDRIALLPMNLEMKKSFALGLRGYTYYRLREHIRYEKFPQMTTSDAACLRQYQLGVQKCRQLSFDII